MVVWLHQPPGVGGEDSTFFSSGSLLAQASAISGWPRASSIFWSETHAQAIMLPTLEVLGEGKDLMLEWLLLLNTPVMRTELGCRDNVL